MAATKAMGIGLDAAMAWFEVNVDEDCPIFSVWQGSNLLCSYYGSDIEEAKQKFNDNIDGLITSGYNDLVTLRSHIVAENEKTKYRFVTAKTPVTSTFYFRPVALQASQYSYNPAGSEYNQQTGNETMGSRLHRLEEKLDNYFTKEDEEDEEPIGAIPIQPKVDAYSLINMFLSNERVQEAVVGKVLSFLGMQPQPINMQQQQIAGVPGDDNHKLAVAISILKNIRPQIVDDLVSLAHIAETDPNKANMILSMLPK